MSTRSAATTVNLRRTAGLPSLTTYSGLALVDLVTSNTYGHVYVRGDSGSGNYLAYGFKGLSTFFGDWDTDNTGTAVSAGDRFHWLGWTKDGTAHKVFLDGVQSISVTSANGATTAAVQAFQFNGGDATSFFNGRIVTMFEWSGVALTQMDMQRQQAAGPNAPVVWPTQLNGWWDMRSASTAVRDLSGRANHWTLSGAPTTEMNPGQLWGTPRRRTAVRAASAATTVAGFETVQSASQPSRPTMLAY